jgi:flavin reductase (DIM6/NTAB) family NADH-FMN oxidoreductase RutF
MTKVVKKPTTILYPVPAVMVSCGTGDRANIITLAWVGTVCSEPPMVGIGVRPSRYSHGLLEDVGEFVVNLPTAEQVEWVDHCGMVSGREADKWADCGFTPVSASEVAVPLIGECPVNIECRVQETLSLGSHDLFIGEVLAVQVDESVLDENDRFDFKRAAPFAFADSAYWGIGELLDSVGCSRKRG